MDADDIIPTEHISTLLEVQELTGADLVSASVTYVPGPIIRHPPCVCDNWNFIELVLYRDGVGDYPVSKLYRRNLFNGLRFVEGITSEDFEIFYRLYRRAVRVAITDRTTYYYRQNNASVSNNGFSEKFLIVLRYVNDCYGILNGKNQIYCLRPAPERLMRLFGYMDCCRKGMWSSGNG